MPSADVASSPMTEASSIVRPTTLEMSKPVPSPFATAMSVAVALFSCAKKKASFEDLRTTVFLIVTPFEFVTWTPRLPELLMSRLFSVSLSASTATSPVSMPLRMAPFLIVTFVALIMSIPKSPAPRISCPFMSRVTPSSWM